MAYIYFSGPKFQCFIIASRVRFYTRRHEFPNDTLLDLVDENIIAFTVFLA